MDHRYIEAKIEEQRCRLENLINTYWLFFINIHGVYNPYGSPLEEDYLTTMKAYWEVQNPGKYRITTASDRLSRFISCIDDLEYLSKLQMEEIMKQTAAFNLKYYNQIVNRLTPEDRAFIKASESSLSYSDLPIVGYTCPVSKGGAQAEWMIADIEEKVRYYNLGEGDHLTLYDDAGSIVFEDIIIYDKAAGWAPFDPSLPFGQGGQVINEKRFSWVQKGVYIPRWKNFFFRRRPLRAQLIKQPMSGSHTAP